MPMGISMPRRLSRETQRADALATGRRINRYPMVTLRNANRFPWTWASRASKCLPVEYSAIHCALSGAKSRK